MSLTQAIHIQCDQCGRWLRDANSGNSASRQGARSYASIKGWTHGTRDLCPVCTDKKLKTVPRLPDLSAPVTGAVLVAGA